MTPLGTGIPALLRENLCSVVLWHLFPLLRAHSSVTLETMMNLSDGPVCVLSTPGPDPWRTLLGTGTAKPYKKLLKVLTFTLELQNDLYEVPTICRIRAPTLSWASEMLAGLKAATLGWKL